MVNNKFLKAKIKIANRVLDKKALIGYEITFQHIYFSNGFAISAAIASDGKEHKPTSTHGCLRYGYWCWDNAKEKPQDILTYFWRTILRILAIKPIDL